MLTQFKTSIFMLMLLPGLTFGDCDPGTGGLFDPLAAIGMDDLREAYDTNDGVSDDIFIKDLCYGDDPLNKFDIYYPEVSGFRVFNDMSEVTEQYGLMPLIIFIHGGSFTSGDKGENVKTNEIEEALEGGAAYATINYRLLAVDGTETLGVKKALDDSMRALQYIRYHAAELNIDPMRIAVYGGSAGATTSLFIAFGDDRADITSNDAIAKQSTRVSAVAARSAQASLDVDVWESDVFVDFGLTVDELLDENEQLKSLAIALYGIDSIESLDQEGVMEYRDKVDVLPMISSDDPPVWLEATQAATEPGVLDTGHIFHHPHHSREVWERVSDMGIQNVANIPDVGLHSNIGRIPFLLNFLEAPLLEE